MRETDLNRRRLASAATLPSNLRRRIRRRDLQATRKALLDAARAVVSRGGLESLHVTEVARLAGITRAGAYFHFPTRELLLSATVESVSDDLVRAVFDFPEFGPNQAVGLMSADDMIEHLATFAMANPELCGFWLQQVLSSDRPRTDRFWNRYLLLMERFAASELAQPDIDVEVHAVVTLAGAFLWAIWTQAQTRSRKERLTMTHRFKTEMIRLALCGTMRRGGTGAIIKDRALDAGG